MEAGCPVAGPVSRPRCGPPDPEIRGLRWSPADSRNRSLKLEVGGRIVHIPSRITKNGSKASLFACGWRVTDQGELSSSSGYDVQLQYEGHPLEAENG